MVAAVSSDLTTAAVLQVSSSDRRFVESRVIFTLGEQLARAAAEGRIGDPSALCLREESAKQLTGVARLDDKWLTVERLKLVHSDRGTVDAYVHSLNPTVGAFVAVFGSTEIQRSELSKIARQLSLEALAAGLLSRSDGGTELSLTNFAEQPSAADPSRTIGELLANTGNSLGTSLSIEQVGLLASNDNDWDA